MLRKYSGNALKLHIVSFECIFEQEKNVSFRAFFKSTHMCAYAYFFYHKGPCTHISKHSE